MVQKWEYMKVKFGGTVASSLGLQWVQAVRESWMSLSERENGTRATMHFFLHKITHYIISFLTHVCYTWGPFLKTKCMLWLFFPLNEVSNCETFFKNSHRHFIFSVPSSDDVMQNGLLPHLCPHRLLHADFCDLLMWLLPLLEEESTRAEIISYHLHSQRTKEMVDTNPKMSVITSNINSLITQLKARDSNR